MPIDKKYGRVILENQRNVGDNEPVVVFRGKDSVLLPLLAHYRKLCKLAGSPDNHLAAIDDTAAGIEAWQQQNGCQIPRSAGYDPRV